MDVHNGSLMGPVLLEWGDDCTVLAARYGNSPGDT